MWPGTFVQVIKLWPTAEALARDIGETGLNVRAWKYRDNIPAHHWVKVVPAAQWLGFRAITYERMALIAAQREQRRDPPPAKVRRRRPSPPAPARR